jgi:hypothetical protein
VEVAAFPRSGSLEARDRIAAEERSRRATEALGLRRLLEFPEAIGPRIRGLRQADPELLDRLSDPDWPDAA